MAEFNVNDYFANRSRALAEEESTNSVQNKYLELQRTSQEKVRQLAEMSSLSKQREVANESSLVNSMGLDVDSAVGSGVNLGARFLAGASKHVVGQLLATPTDLDALTFSGQLEPEDYNAYNRQRQGVATPMDLERLNQKGTVNNSRNVTKMESFANINQRRENSKAIRDAFNIDYLTNKSNTDQLTDQLKTGFKPNWDQVLDGWNTVTEGKGTADGLKNLASGLGGLIANVGRAAVDNPMAATEYITENLPQLLVGIGGKAATGILTATNVGYAMENYNEGIAKYQAANLGAFPPEDERNRMATAAASLALAEQLGDVTVLKSMFPGKAVTGAADVAADAAKNSFKKALLGTTGAVATSTLSESATEGWQTFAEGELKGGITEGNGASAEDIYVGAAIGGIVGGGISAGTRAPTEAAKLVADNMKPTKTYEDVSKLQKEAIATGDVSSLTDPETPAYAPDKAIAALMGNNQLETSTPETVTANSAKAEAIVAGLEEKKNELIQEIERETVEGAKTQLAVLQEDLNATDPANTDRVAALQNLIELRAEDIVDLEAGNFDPKRKVAMEKQLANVEATLSRTYESKKQLDLLTQRSINLDEQIANINAPSTPAANVAGTASTPEQKAQDARAAGVLATARTSAESVINLAMATPDLLDSKKALALADNTTNALTPDERSFLRKFSEARVAQNALMDMGSVSQQIYLGGNGNVGIKDYQESMSKAVSARNEKSARKSLQGLQNFADNHEQKAKVAREAITRGKGIQIVYGDNNWSFSKTKLDPVKLTSNGGLTINSEELVQNIERESNALNMSLLELQASFDLKFKPAAAAVKPVSTVPATPVIPVKTTGANNVENIQREALGTQSQSKAAEVQRPETATDNAPIAEQPLPATERSAGNTAVVEAARVDQKSTDKAATATSAEVSKTAESIENTQEANASTVVAKSDQVTESTQSVQVTEVIQETTVETQSTDNNTEELDQDVPANSETVNSATVTQTLPQGGIVGIATKSPEGTSYELRQLLAEYFNQGVVEEGSSIQRPLVAVKDFMSSLANQSTTAVEFLTEKTLNEAQKAALQMFFKHVKAWKGKIQANLPKIQPDQFRSGDMMQYLLQKNEDGTVDVDENVKTAITFAVYSWVSEAASKPRRLKDDAINAILGRKKDVRVSQLAREKLSLAGLYQHVLVDSLGGKVMEALNIRIKSDAPQNLASTLRVALGSHALKLAEDTGVAVRTRITGSDIRTLREQNLSEEQLEKLYKKNGETNIFLPHDFFAVARDAKGELTPDVKRIFEANRGSQSVLNKLFQVETSVIIPSLEPVTTTQRKAANSEQGIPSKLAKVVLGNQANARTVRKDTLELLGNFDEDQIHALIGVTPEDNETTHKANRSSVEAKNGGLIREYDLFMEYVGDYLATSEKKLDTPFFLTFSVWKQQRVGIETTAINPQTSKIHRFLVGSPAWKAEIPLLDGELMNSFFLRVAEGIGIKTERVDNQASIDEIQSTMATEVYASAIAALRKQMVQKEGLTEEEKESIVTAVLKGKAKLHTLDALIGMAYYLEAKETNAESFTVEMMGEVDGVANGTMLNHVLLGAADDVSSLNRITNKGGFYEEGSKFTQYNQYRGTPGNLDIYEDTGRALFGKIQQTMKDFTAAEQSQVNSIWAVIGELFSAESNSVTKDGRNLVKDAMNPLSFGSSMDSVVNGMVGSFIDSVYTGFEKLYGKNQLSLEAYVDHINTLIGDKGPHLETGYPLAYYMETMLHPASEKAIGNVFRETVGEATAQVLKTKFAVFLERRDALNRAAQQTYGLYEAMYEGTRESYVADLTESKEIPTNANGQAIADLSKKQEDELSRQLSPVRPVLNTVMSKKDKGNRSGMLMAKTERKAKSDSIYANTTKFGAPLKTGDKSVKIKGLASQLVNIGVSMGSAATHSLDSAISHLTQGLRDVLNVHDAVGDGVAGLKASAQLMNKHTWDSLLDYSPLEEVYQSMSRTVQGISKMIDKESFSDAAAVTLQNYLWKQADKASDLPANVLLSMLYKAKQEAFKADIVKLNTMAAWAHVDQYAYQGGNYVVTAEDRSTAVVKLKALSNEINKEDSIAFEKIMARLSNVEYVDKDIASMDSDMETDTVSKKVSPFGPLGVSAIDSDPALVEFFQQNPETTYKRVIEGLLKRYQQDTKLLNREFNIKLLKMVYKQVDLGFKVRYITADTAATMPIGGVVQNVRGWFSLSGKQEEIYVMSPEFKSSGLTPEMLLHELVHAALTRQINNQDAASMPYINELNELLSLAQKYVKQNGLSTKYAEATKNIDELIAYGMTNRDFQIEVLSQLSMKSKTLGNIATLLQTFIANITKMLGFKEAVDAQGLGVLVGNVTVLMSMASESKAEKASETSAINLNMASPMGNVNTYNTLDIHEALADGTTAPAFDIQLRSLLAGIVQSIHGPFGAFKAALMKDQALSPTDTWLKALNTGVAPFASETLASGFVTSQQEAFAIEQVETTIKAGLDGNDSQTKLSYKELSELYTETYERMKVKDFHKGDWTTATQNERDVAQNKYDFLFKLDRVGNNKSDYLARFAALGLAHSEVNNLLKVATENNSRKAINAKTFTERLQIIFENVLAFFQSKVTKTYKGQQADEKLNLLVSQLVDIEAKKRYKLAHPAQNNFIEPIEAGVKKAADAVRQKASDIGNSNFVRNNGNTFVRAAGGLIRIAANDQVDELIGKMQEMRNSAFAEQQGVIASLVGEFKGSLVKFQELLRATKKREGERKKIITQIGKDVLEIFANKGKDLSKDMRSAITGVFLSTGAHQLVAHFSMNELQEILTDNTVRNKAIADFETKLDIKGLAKFKPYFIEQANVLAHERATGKVSDSFQLMNAHNIAKLYGTPFQAQITEAQAAQVKAVLEPLIALYAIQYADSVALDNAQKVLSLEILRTDGTNGIEFVLKLHKQLEQESLNRLFGGRPELMMHGYTPEIYDPHVAITTANMADGQSLLEQGYVRHERVVLDPADPNRDTKHIYVLKDGGLSSRITGVASFTSMNAKGKEKNNGFTNSNTLNGVDNAAVNAAIAQQRQADIARLFVPGPRRDLSKVKATYMSPVLSETGNTAKWRYLMQHSTKDALLRRDNSFDHVMGTMGGSIFDKQTSQETNAVAFTALKEQYDLDYAKNSQGYMLVGPKSTDPQLREIWKMLPEASKEDAKRIWGYDGMQVRSDTLDIVFGYRKLSLADMFDKSPDQRRALENLFVGVMEWSVGQYGKIIEGRDKDEAIAFAKRAAVAVTRGERAWQALVSEAKDILVVKTGVVMLGNIFSNITLLALNGVPLMTAIKHHLVAFKGASAYKRDSTELAQLKRLVNMKYTQGKDVAIERQIIRLEDALERNPVKKMIDAGMMPTIVEDLAANEDDYSYKSEMTRRFDTYASKLNPKVVSIAKNIYMAHDTKIYQTLSFVTQQSDFVARYTLFQHLISKTDPLTEADAIQEASDAFVNYDIPMHRFLQYTDDMGITMFVKYFVRIQKVLAKLMKEHPARVLSMLAMDHFMNLGPIVLESSMWGRIGNNPLQEGAFKFFTSLDDLLTVNSALKLVK